MTTADDPMSDKRGAGAWRHIRVVGVMYASLLAGLAGGMVVLLVVMGASAALGDASSRTAFGALWAGRLCDIAGVVVGGLLLAKLGWIRSSIWVAGSALVGGMAGVQVGAAIERVTIDLDGLIALGVGLMSYGCAVLGASVLPELLGSRRRRTTRCS